MAVVAETARFLKTAGNLSNSVPGEQSMELHLRALQVPPSPEDALAAESRLLFKRVDYTLDGLLNYIDIGEVGLPDIQRPFVWPATKVRDLFDSMYRGLPVGYLLFWSSAGNGALRPRDGRFDVTDAAIRKDPEFIADISDLPRSRSQTRSTERAGRGDLRAHQEPGGHRFWREVSGTPISSCGARTSRPSRSPTSAAVSAKPSARHMHRTRRAGKGEIRPVAKDR